MSEEKAAERQFLIQRIYTKDVSFESPNAPSVFTNEWKPEVKVNLGTQIDDLGSNSYEVTLTVNVEAKVGDSTAYMAEVQQGGIFVAAGFQQEELTPMLGIAAPNVLFPYAREAISDLITRGSFPQFVLQPVNFEAMFHQQMANQNNANEAH